jgi:CRISPR/Cas system endoribonuclease Cas6 (RAMP superfamily)
VEADSLQCATLKALNTLVCYAKYAGLGDRTSIGMGYAQSPGTV